jgi:hypothetical protein
MSTFGRIAFDFREDFQKEFLAHHNSNSRIKLFINVYVPTLHHVTVVRITKVVSFRAAGVKLNRHFFKEAVFFLSWSVVSWSTLCALLDFCTFSIMVIFALTFSNVTVDTFVCFRISVKTLGTSSTRNYFIRLELNSGFCVTQNWQLPTITLCSLAILVALCYDSSFV